MFNKIVVQTEAKEILDEMGIDVYPYKENYFVADSIESVASLTLKAVKAGAQIFNLMNAEDVLVRNGKVTGVVVNWSSVESARLHVDPIAVKAKYVVDATGHTAAVASVLQSKQRIKLKTKTGSILGEQSMWAEVGEKTIVDNTKLIYPGLYATGMAANAIFGGPRMGPIFGGMLLSGRKVASLISNKLKE
jgi:thiamine thiazole synthase